MTALWTSAAIADATGGRETAAFEARGVSIDTRTLQPGDLFVALVGERDGHAHVEAAMAAGAAGVLVHREPPAGVPAVVVGDTLAALQALGAAGRARFDGRVVAVTGSVGKTTTKEMLRAALAPFGTVHAAEASYNNHWGLPLTLARLPAAADFCVCEIGMNNPGEIAPLARLAAPEVAAITNIEAAHIGHLGSLEAIADEKGSILEGLLPDGRAVLPIDSAQYARLRALAGETVTFGREEAADVRLEGETLVVCGKRLTLALSAPGAHLRINAAGAIGVVVALGLDPAVAVDGLAAFRPMGGRGMQRTIGSVTLLDESYNANGASVRAALAVLREMGGRRVAVLGDMLELGSFGPAEHAGLADDVAASADVLYACGALMRHLFETVPSHLRGELAADSAALAPIVAASVRPGDSVLIKGSLGSRMRVVVTGLEARLSEGSI